LDMKDNYKHSPYCITLQPKGIFVSDIAIIV
jgi:hypothetical protein